jgi:hypothetical protein
VLVEVGADEGVAVKVGSGVCVGVAEGAAVADGTRSGAAAQAVGSRINSKDNISQITGLKKALFMFVSMPLNPLVALFLETC